MTTPPQGSRTAAIRLVIMAAVIVLTFLFTPKRDIGDCVFTLRFAHAVKWPHNCDSPSIAANALNLERFVTADNPWRTRPIYIVSVGTLAHMLSPLIVLANPLVKSAELPSGAMLQGLDRTVKRYFLVYLAVVIFNAGLLTLMIAGAISLVGPRHDGGALAIAAVLAASDIVAGWFWIPHTIMMNGLVPIGGALAYLFGMTLALRQPGHAALWGLAQAAGCLTYGLALTWPVLTGLGLVHVLLLHRTHLPVPAAIRNFAIFSVAVCLPLLLWFGSYFLRGQMVAYEAQSVGQFQWIGTALSAGTLPTTALQQFVGMLEVWAINFRWIGWLIITGFILSAGYALWQGRQRRVLADPVIVACIATLLCLTLFTYLQGYHQPRLYLPALSLVSLMTFRLLAQAGRERLASAVLGMTALLTLIALSLAPAVTQT